MAGEWKRASWTYKPTGGLGHTPATIVAALASFLTQCGWELSTWSGTGDDRHLLRADRYTVQLANKVVGTAGNVAVTKVGAAITVTGMTGGTVSVAATGEVKLTALPADGDTVTISDGTNSKVFEFDSNAAVTGSNVSVAIGSTRDQTLDNLSAAINAQTGYNILGAVPTRWRFTGDGPTLHGGIRVRFVTASARLEISSFIENTGITARAYETGAGHIMWVTYSQVADNVFLLYGGEDGLYYEAGVSGSNVNIAHGLVAAFKVNPDLSGTKDAQVRWTGQGLAMDLFGNLKFTEDRNSRFVDNNGSNKNYSCRLRPQSPRGTTTVLTSTQVTNQSYYVGCRDNLIGLVHDGNSLGNGSTLSVGWGFATFGVVNSPVDDRYKVSPMLMIQHLVLIATGANSASAANNVAPDGGSSWYMEPRWVRDVCRLVAVDQTLLPWNNITDSVYGRTYRIAQVADGGRASNIGIEYPTVTATIAATPT